MHHIEPAETHLPGFLLCVGFDPWSRQRWLLADQVFRLLGIHAGDEKRVLQTAHLGREQMILFEGNWYCTAEQARLIAAVASMTKDPDAHISRASAWLHRLLPPLEGEADYQGKAFVSPEVR